MYLIYHPLSDREFTAIPMACVSKAKLIWIGFIFQSSAPLSTRKKAAPTMKCRATDGSLHALCLAGFSWTAIESPEGSRTVWRTSSNHLGRQTSSHRHEAADRNVSVWTLDAVANLRKTKWSNQTKPKQSAEMWTASLRCTLASEYSHFPWVKQENKQYLIPCVTMLHYTLKNLLRGSSHVVCS